MERILCHSCPHSISGPAGHSVGNRAFSWVQFLRSLVPLACAVGALSYLMTIPPY